MHNIDISIYCMPFVYRCSGILYNTIKCELFDLLCARAEKNINIREYSIV